jgi:sulfatase maturation enzyme AslB (radical SAM superfamily)
MTTLAQDRGHEKAQDIFCVIPWMHRFTDEQGYSSLCCVGDRDEGFLRDANGERLNVSQMLTDEQVLNSPTAKAVRVQMMNGEWPKACERCRLNEASGATSIRHHLSERFEHGRRAEWLADTAPDGTLGHPVVRYSDIRLGNACNLTCRMCGPNASRLWAPIYNQLQPKDYRMPESELVHIGKNNWVKHDSVEALLGKSLDGLEAMHFAGGEPMIIPEMVQALQMCIASGRAGEIGLSYNTNLTVLPEKVTSLWKHFKSVSLLCSVDGFGRVTEYIRRPSKWADIDRNIKIIDEHYDEWKIQRAQLSITVQLYNILNLHDLFEYLRNAGLKKFRILPHFVPLFYPGYLSIQALPKAAKKIARERLMRELDRPEARQQPDYDYFAGCIAATLAFLDEADTSADLVKFLEFCDNSDKAFGDSWRDSLPELAKAIDRLGRGWSWPSLASFGLRSNGLTHTLQRRLRQNAQGPDR